MVYYFLWQNELPALPAQLKKYLSSQRNEKVLSYKQAKDRITSVYAFLLLRYALFKEYGITSMPQIETDENGKPFEVKNEYFFNLSHCDTAVACALDYTPVGIDVQDFHPVKDNVVQRVCSLQEQKMLSQCANPEQFFAAFWASKEAWGKYTGQGIGYDLQSTCFCGKGEFPCLYKAENVIIQTDLKNTFALSVCAQRQLQAIYVKNDELLCFLQEL